MYGPDEKVLWDSENGDNDADEGLWLVCCCFPTVCFLCSCCHSLAVHQGNFLEDGSPGGNLHEMTNG